MWLPPVMRSAGGDTRAAIALLRRANMRGGAGLAPMPVPFGFDSDKALETRVAWRVFDGHADSRSARNQQRLHGFVSGRPVMAAARGANESMRFAEMAMQTPMWRDQ